VEIRLNPAMAMRAALPWQRLRRENVHSNHIVLAVTGRTDHLLELEERFRGRFVSSVKQQLHKGMGPGRR
jgi:hypothetical protein